MAAGAGRPKFGGGAVIPIGNDQTWIGITGAPLATTEAVAWASGPDCGAVVTFCGTVREFSEGRRGVTSLEYEAYADVAERKLAQIAEAASARWTTIRRVVIVHRVGILDVGDAAVLVVVASPHRDEAFESARFCIDTLKATVPIWKRETWSGGCDWGLCAQPVADCSHGAPTAWAGKP